MPIEQFAGVTEERWLVSGDAVPERFISDVAHTSGTGPINPIEIAIQGQGPSFHEIIAFDYNPRLRECD